MSTLKFFKKQFSSNVSVILEKWLNSILTFLQWHHLFKVEHGKLQFVLFPSFRASNLWLDPNIDIIIHIIFIKTNFHLRLLMWHCRIHTGLSPIYSALYSSVLFWYVTRVHQAGRLKFGNNFWNINDWVFNVMNLRIFWISYYK